MRRGSRGRKPLTSRGSGGGGGVRSPRLRTGGPGHAILQLQQAAGNQAVGQLLTSALEPQAARASDSAAGPAAAGPAPDAVPAVQPETPETPSPAPTPGPTTPDGPAATSPAEAQTAAGASWIVEDDTEQPGPGQMRKSDFLADLEGQVCVAADAAMKTTGQTTEGCPYISYWFDYYRDQDAAHLERALRRFVPEAVGVGSASGYIPFVVERVRRSVEAWARTGEITGLPEGMQLPGTGLLGGLAGFFGGGSPAPDGAPPANPLRMRLPGGPGPDPGRLTPGQVQGQLGPGRPLDGDLRSRMESAFGQSFSHVRLHADRTAAHLSDRLSASAFTVGRHVAFGAGQFQPGSPLGDALVAHELAHVVQQGGATAPAPAAQKESASTPALEADANTAAAGAVVSLWGRAQGAALRLAAGTRAALGSGLALQRCSTPMTRFTKCADPTPTEWHKAVEAANALSGDQRRDALAQLVRQQLCGATVHVSGNSHGDELHPDDNEPYPALNFDINFLGKRKFRKQTVTRDLVGNTFHDGSSTYIVLGPSVIDTNTPSWTRMYADHEVLHAESGAGSGPDDELATWADTFVSYFHQVPNRLHWKQFAQYEKAGASPKAAGKVVDKLADYYSDPPVAKEGKEGVRERFRNWLSRALTNFPDSKLLPDLAARIHLDPAAP